MARKKNRKSFLKKFFIIAGVLIAVQIVIIVMYSSQDAPLTIRESIDQEISKQTALDPERRELLRVQLALAHYQGEHRGSPPAKLEELVPKYFDQVPVDPSTQKPFAYRVDNKRYFLGNMTKARKSSEKKKKGARGAEKDDATVSAEEEKLLIASLTEDSEAEKFLYDPTGKRDPFMPYQVQPVSTEGKTELETYSLGQLKLTIVMEDPQKPRAVVENEAGRGFIVHKGTKIGQKGGEVVEIHPNKLVIVETEVDFTGKENQNVVEMYLRDVTKN